MKKRLLTDDELVDLCRKCLKSDCCGHGGCSPCQDHGDCAYENYQKEINGDD